MGAGERLIIVDVQLQKEIARSWDVTDKTVRNALNYTSNSPLARRIRRFALQKGGKLFVHQEDDQQY